MAPSTLLLAALLVADPQHPSPPAPAQPPAPQAQAAPQPAPAPQPALVPQTPAARTLSLEEAVRTALARQPQLRQARAGVEVAVARADEARAPLLPQVNLSASYQRTTANSTFRPGGTTGGTGVGSGTGEPTGAPAPSFASYNFFSFGGNASQLIYDFGQTWGRYQAALSNAEAQRATELSNRLQVVLGVQVAYFGARAQKQLIEVARETLENQLRHQQQTEGFVQVGTRAPIDLAQARTDTANARVQLITAQNNYRTSLAQLNHAMGVEGPIDYDVAEEELPPLPQEGAPLEKLVDEAVAARPELAAFERSIHAQQQAAAAVRGGYFPSLGASAGINDVGTSLDRLVWNWNAQLTLTWAIFQGGLTSAQAREADATLASLEAQRDLAHEQVRLDVETAKLTLEGAKAALEASEEALANARERLRLAEGRYQTGVGSAIELGDAQLALTAAAAQRVQAVFNVATARARLLGALGVVGSPGH